MKIAVITPYYKTEPAWLEQCCASVNAQTHPCTHFLIADGIPQSLPDGFNGQHLVLPANHGDYGDTPRALGAITAINQGFDALAFLDADNWYEPDHIQAMVDLQAAEQADICTATRNLFTLEGELLGQCTESDGAGFTDSNCLFLTRRAFPSVNLWWMMPKKFHCIGDRYVWYQIGKLGYKTAHCDTPSVGYRTAFEWHYKSFGRTPPPEAKKGDEILATLKVFQQQIAKQGSA
jgi:hypothetical protein